MIDFVKDLAIQAGQEVLSLRGKARVRSKTRLGDIVTIADTVSEKIILKGLKKEFPRHNFVSEESSRENNKSEYTWFVDPLDGTIPYVAGMPTFGVSIGLVKGEIPVLGVVNLPALNSLYWAEKGGGSFLDGEKIHVSNKQDLLSCIVGLDVGYVGGRAKELRSFAEPIVDKVRYTPILGCSVAGISYVAGGIYDAYLHSAHPWDFAAGALLVEEAGGKVTDFKGNPIDWSKDWIDLFASNGKIHGQILNLLKR